VSRPSRQRELRKDKRGAVYVEFLGAFFPIFFSFWCLLQSAGMYSAKLVTMNAAYLGARAAAVVIPDDPKRYSKADPYKVTGKRKEAITKAVQMGLAANGSLWWPLADVTVRGSDGKEKTQFSRDELVIVRVSVPYACGLPLADTVVCGFAGIRNVQAEAAMVVHGADYVYP
jgi:hypothetical protein